LLKLRGAGVECVHLIEQRHPALARGYKFVPVAARDRVGRRQLQGQEIAAMSFGVNTVEEISR